MAKRRVQMKQGGEGAPASPRWAGMMLLLLAGFGFAPLAAASEAGFEAGIRCVTRMQSREVSARHFVVEPVTFCMPVRDCGLGQTGVGQGTALASMRSEGTSDVVMPARRPMPTAMAKASGIRSRAGLDGVEAKPRAAQVPRWSRGRGRLSNAQYASSVRELRGAIRPTKR